MHYCAKITGTGCAFPKHRVTNDDIVTKLAGLGLETSTQWIEEMTGIKERRHVEPDNPGEFNSALGVAAARKALEMAGKKATDIDQIIYATCSPDTLLPATACWLQAEIGAKNAWAMDINAACSGFIYGLTIADQFIRTGKTRTVLVIGAEVLSFLINWHDRSSCILFGDGAGAAIVEQAPADSESRILSSRLHSNGELAELLHVPGGGSRMETTVERVAQRKHKARMNGREIFKTAVRSLSQLAEDTLAENALSLEELDWFIPHQANIRIIDAVVNRLKISREKVVINITNCGNTSAATVPTALDGAVRDGRIRKGQYVLLDAFGAGLTYGALLLRW